MRKVAPRLGFGGVVSAGRKILLFFHCPVIVYKASAGLCFSVHAIKIKEISAAFTPKITQKAPSFCTF
jgi:hypothetical protein